MTQNSSVRKWSALFIGFAFTFSASAYGDTFSCPDGTKMMCLGFGDKVVSSNSVCLDRFQCSQEGFVCKSEMDDLAKEHEALMNKHNDLVNTYNELVGVHESTVSGYERLQRCVDSASTLKEAKNCASKS